MAQNAGDSGHAAVNYLAIDPGTYCGWSALIKGERTSGCAVFENEPGEDRGWRYIRFSVWLYRWRGEGLNLIVYEKPLIMRGSLAAAEVALGIGTRIQEFAARERIPFKIVANNVIKKWATGNGRAEKETMVRAAQVLKKGVTDHNEADALWLLAYSEAQWH
jgi:hypothetical protein